jgi:hypothetical protein
MRVLYYKALASGNAQPAVSDVDAGILTHGYLTTYTDSSRAGTYRADNTTDRADPE